MYEVLDGQQRLTTLTILMAVLRDYLDGEYSKSLNKTIARKGDFLLKTQGRYRIELRERDQDFFQQYIQQDNATTKLDKKVNTKTDSQSLIRDNALYILERLNEIDTEKVQTL